MSAVAVAQSRWVPVSAGEYDRRTRTITVNLTVVDEVARRFGHDPSTVMAAVVAHERAHVSSSPGAQPHEEERAAREAAAAVAGVDVVRHIDAVLAGAWS